MKTIKKLSNISVQVICITMIAFTFAGLIYTIINHLNNCNII